jgi:hypothetical protein
MAWGESWLVPIQERLSQRLPELSPAQLSDINEICQSAMRAGHDIVKSLAQTRGTPSEYPNPEEFKANLLQKFPWIDEVNAGKLFSQGVYYSLK